MISFVRKRCKKMAPMDFGRKFRLKQGVGLRIRGGMMLSIIAQMIIRFRNVRNDMT
jgi:hypothetical protein